jgi:SAM-dependent methyltransferase
VKESLQNESEKLRRSWMQHESAWLRDYLVSGVEDPRLNLQSIFSRHFLTRSVLGESLNALMEQEHRFAAAMNWLKELAGRGGGPEECEAVLHALRHGSDNAEGLEIPWFLVETFGRLPELADGLIVPNYLEQFLAGNQQIAAPAAQDAIFNTFRDLWLAAFSRAKEETLRSVQDEALSAASSHALERRSVLEPACGSANDYRFFEAYGLARWLDYSGFDICARNIENAQALFPQVRFEVGNVFEIPAPDKAFDLCIVHDLFEHLSLEGLQAAIKEVCRVTRSGICAGFFQMDEIRDHIIRPINEYYWNLLSMARTMELFEDSGFTGQVIHIGTFLRDQVGWDRTHNPNAYTFWLHNVGHAT